MTRLLRALICLVVSVGLGVGLPAQDVEPAPASAAATDTPKEHMKQINSSLRAVAAFLKEPTGEAPTAHVIGMQQAAFAAKIATPPLTEKQPEEKRAEFLKAYRAQVNVLLRNLLDLEDALEQEDWSTAKEILGRLNQVKRDGHGKFKGRERRGGRRGRE